MQTKITRKYFLQTESEKPEHRKTTHIPSVPFLWPILSVAIGIYPLRCRRELLTPNGGGICHPFIPTIDP